MWIGIGPNILIEIPILCFEEIGGDGHFATCRTRFSAEGLHTRVIVTPLKTQGEQATPVIKRLVPQGCRYTPP